MLMLIEVPPCRPLSKQFKRVCCAPVAQMDRALASGAKGRGFESLLARHLFPGPARTHGLHNAPGAHSMPRTAQGATAGRASTNEAVKKPPHFSLAKKVACRKLAA